MAINIQQTEKKRLVIIGAGFGGLKLAMNLIRSDYQIVLIDKNNYHQFQPLFYQVASSGLEPSSISFPLRKIFQKKKNIHIRIAEVYTIDENKQQLKTSLGAIGYDYLVIATGVNSNFFGNKKIEENALPMKSVSEALMLRNVLLSNFEDALTITDEKERYSLLNVIVVGGGPTGVEISGAIAEMKKFVLPKDYPEIDFNHMNISLVEASERVLATMSEQSSEKALQYLKRLGIQTYLSHKVIDYDGKIVRFENGRTLESQTLIWAAGIKGEIPDGIPAEKITKGNQIMVNEYHCLADKENIFVIGDAAFLVNNAYPHGHPQVAQVAIQQAENLARNLKAINKDKKLCPFHYKDKGSLATIGRNRAVADLPYLRFGGFLAWLVWMFVHLMSIVGVKNRLIIFINWTWNYLTYDQSLRLILRASDLPKNKKGSILK